MELSGFDLHDNYRHLLDICEPYLISYPANYPSLDLAPFGLKIPDQRLYTATSTKSSDVVEGLHHLDAATFGDQAMLMPRWVLFDCGEFPGIVFGFGRRAADLSPATRAIYRVGDRDDAFVPLSMWVAIRCAEPDAWFGHNLSSANVILVEKERLPGLATLTKVLGLRLTRATKQYGATQWTSPSIGLHLRLGEVEVLSAFTPAHTHPETFAYRLDVKKDRLMAALVRGWKPSHELGDLQFAGDDSEAINALHDTIEAGKRWRLVRAERRAEQAQLLHLSARKS